jgi:hypothetical protein
MPRTAEQWGAGKAWWLAIPPILFVLASVAPMAAQQRPFTEVARAGPTEGVNNPRRSLVDAVRYVETPFVQEYSFPLSELRRGHLEVDGFSSNYSMENLLWGLPAAGNLPSWGVTSQSHVAVSAPNQAGNFGFALFLHFTTSESNNGYFRPREWVSRLMHSSRG